MKRSRMLVRLDCVRVAKIGELNAIAEAFDTLDVFKSDVISSRTAEILYCVDGNGCAYNQLGSGDYFLEMLEMEQVPNRIDLMYMPIRDLGFSVRTYNCLKRADVNYLWELLSLTEEDLYMVRNMNARCVEEVKEVLTEMGFEIYSEDTGNDFLGLEISEEEWLDMLMKIVEEA